MAPGPYAILRAEAVGRSVVTTTTPVGAYRSAGRPEATAALERVALVALGGSVEVLGPGGSRRVSADDFFTGFFETSL